MCILFIFVSSIENDSDYSLILASNRDEYYDRPTQCFEQWAENTEVFGGRDLQEGAGGGTWLALSPSRNKIGVLLNIPGKTMENAQSRGKIVADYITSNQSTKEYVESIKGYATKCNGFVFVTIEFGATSNLVLPKISTYSNTSDQLMTHADQFLGFGNCLPDEPLKKVEAGRCKLEDICSKYNKVDQKEELVENILQMLKSEQRYLPDPQLERRRPTGYEYLSSLFVSIPELRYGTRTHTLILVTKKGDVNVIETTLKDPIDPLNQNWLKTEYNFNLCK